MEGPKLVVELVPGRHHQRPRAVVPLVDDNDVARGDGPRAVDAEVLAVDGQGSSFASGCRRRVVVAVGRRGRGPALGAEVDVEDHSNSPLRV